MFDSGPGEGREDRPVAGATRATASEIEERASWSRRCNACCQWTVFTTLVVLLAITLPLWLLLHWIFTMSVGALSAVLFTVCALVYLTVQPWSRIELESNPTTYAFSLSTIDLAVMATFTIVVTGLIAGQREAARVTATLGWLAVLGMTIAKVVTSPVVLPLGIIVTLPLMCFILFARVWNLWLPISDSNLYDSELRLLRSALPSNSFRIVRTHVVGHRVIIVTDRTGSSAHHKSRLSDMTGVMHTGPEDDSVNSVDSSAPEPAEVRMRHRHLANAKDRSSPAPPAAAAAAAGDGHASPDAPPHATAAAAGPGPEDDTETPLVQVAEEWVETTAQSTKRFGGVYEATSAETDQWLAGVTLIMTQGYGGGAALCAWCLPPLVRRFRRVILLDWRESAASQRTGNMPDARRGIRAVESWFADALRKVLVQLDRDLPVLDEITTRSRKRTFPEQAAGIGFGFGAILGGDGLSSGNAGMASGTSKSRRHATDEEHGLMDGHDDNDDDLDSDAEGRGHSNDAIDVDISELPQPTLTGHAPAVARGAKRRPGSFRRSGSGQRLRSHQHPDFHHSTRAFGGGEEEAKRSEDDGTSDSVAPTGVLDDDGAAEAGRIAPGLGRFVLLGHSFGGYMSSAYALRSGDSDDPNYGPLPDWYNRKPSSWKSAYRTTDSGSSDVAAAAAGGAAGRDGSKASEGATSEAGTGADGSGSVGGAPCCGVPLPCWPASSGSKRTGRSRHRDRSYSDADGNHGADDDDAEDGNEDGSKSGWCPGAFGTGGHESTIADSVPSGLAAPLVAQSDDPSLPEPQYPRSKRVPIPDHLLLASPLGMPLAKPEVTRRQVPTRSIFWAISSWLWELGATPQLGMRLMGPFCRLMVQNVVDTRVRRWETFKAVPKNSVNPRDMGDYLFETVARPSGDEVSLSMVVEVGAWPKLSMGARLINGLPPSMPVSFLYGAARDWMGSLYGRQVSKRLASRWQEQVRSRTTGLAASSGQSERDALMEIREVLEVAAGRAQSLIESSPTTRYHRGQTARIFASLDDDVIPADWSESGAPTRVPIQEPPTSRVRFEGDAPPPPPSALTFEPDPISPAEIDAAAAELLPILWHKPHRTSMDSVAKAAHVLMAENPAGFAARVIAESAAAQRARFVRAVALWWQCCRAYGWQSDDANVRWERVRCRRGPVRLESLRILRLIAKQRLLPSHSTPLHTPPTMDGPLGPPRVKSGRGEDGDDRLEEDDLDERGPADASARASAPIATA